MKLLLVLFLIILRIIIAIKIMFWLVQEFKFPEQYSFTDIEFYLILLLFDMWISTTSVVVGHPPNDKNKD